MEGESRLSLFFLVEAMGGLASLVVIEVYKTREKIRSVSSGERKRVARASFRSVRVQSDFMKKSGLPQLGSFRHFGLCALVADFSVGVRTR